MYHNPRAKWQLRLVNAGFVVLFLVAIGLLHWLSNEFHLRYDLTQNRRYSLSPASVAAIERLQGPITVTAFAGRDSTTRSLIRDIIGRYQQHKSDIEIEFVDSDVEPQRVRDANAQEGELQIRYGEARENIPPLALTEENLTNAFTRLGHRGERWLVFLSGHGERSPDKQANFDLTTWAAQLGKRGFKTRTITLGETAQIPQNTTALVIAGPRVRLFKGEVKAIDSYLKRGGNLLWLADPGSLQGLEPIAEQLGVELQPGTVVDPTSETATGNPAAIVVNRYSAHPVVRDFNQSLTTYFPNSAALALRPSQGWTSSVLLDTSERAWSETGPMSGSVEFNSGKDIGGPLILGVALTHPVEGREQRIALIGDGDFLSNQFIANGGNLELGMSLVNWLSHDDSYVNIPVRTSRDRIVEFSRTSAVVIYFGFQWIIPLLLGVGGFVTWWRRRKR
jgi:ABC-type uncharacterized transport system involved in gliding motility auxiliary subunit